MVTKQKILIVDDDNNIAELISLYLTKECFETRIVNDGEQALKDFASFQPDLILLDLMLPGIDGYQVCREIRHTSDVPIIMLSAKGETFDKVLGLELGAGEIKIDDMAVFDNEKAKEQVFYISDDCYFPTNYTALDMAAFYQLHYPKFEKQRFAKLMNQFQLDERRKVGSFSKGMKKQLMVLLGISAGTKYLLCDETFDGLRSGSTSGG